MISDMEPPKVAYARRLEQVPITQNIVAPTGDEQGRIDTQLAAYGTVKGPGEAFPLFPEVPQPGEDVVAPPLPKSRRPPCPEGYQSRTPGPNTDWVKQMQRMSARSKPLPKLPASKPLPPWKSSVSGKWTKVEMLSSK